MYGLVDRHKWSKWSILSYFLQKRVFLKIAFSAHQPTCTLRISGTGQLYHLLFFLSVSLGCLLGPELELDIKLIFLMTQRPFCTQRGPKKQRFFEKLRKNHSQLFKKCIYLLDSSSGPRKDHLEAMFKISDQSKIWFLRSITSKKCRFLALFGPPRATR